jgi:Pvc16 N-terminal domain
MLYDLSAVTDGLLGVVQTAWPSASLWTELGLEGPSFTPNYTGLAPDAIRNESGPQLSLFLYHVELNNAQEALFWTPQTQDGTEPSTSYIPLALNLYYLLSAFSEGNYAQEQQAMSIAMRLFHATPIISSDSTATPAWQVNVTMEHRSYDELSLLWQATTAPLRLSTVYRAAVVFVAPDASPTAPPMVTAMTATVNGSDTLTLTPADVPTADWPPGYTPPPSTTPAPTTAPPTTTPAPTTPPPTTTPAPTTSAGSPA